MINRSLLHLLYDCNLQWQWMNHKNEARTKKKKQNEIGAKWEKKTKIYTNHIHHGEHLIYENPIMCADIALMPFIKEFMKWNEAQPLLFICCPIKWNRIF